MNWPLNEAMRTETAQAPEAANKPATFSSWWPLALGVGIVPLALWYLNKKKNPERQELVNLAKEIDMDSMKIVDRLIDRLIEADERARRAEESYRVKLEAAHSAELALDNQRMDTATELAAYKKRNGELIELLRECHEWLRTPHFTDKRPWKKWAAEFRARITALIG